jgi:hypothetical protein
MLQLTLELFDKCDSSDLGGYRFLGQEFRICWLLHIFHYIQFLNHIVVN